MTLQKKTIFIIEPDHVLDIITNSSSELFVLEGETKSIVEELIADTYCDYLSEYEPIKSIEELSNSELNTYLNHKYYSGYGSKPTELIPGFTFEEMYKETSYGYSLRNNKGYGFVYEGNRKRIEDGIDPDRKMYFLFSLEENPDWEMQKKLESIGIRYRLG